MIFKEEPIKSVIAYEAKGELYRTEEEAKAGLCLEALKKHTYIGKDKNEFDEQKFVDKFGKIMDDFRLIRYGV